MIIYLGRVHFLSQNINEAQAKNSAKEEAFLSKREKMNLLLKWHFKYYEKGEISDYSSDSVYKEKKKNSIFKRKFLVIKDQSIFLS